MNILKIVKWLDVKSVSWYFETKPCAAEYWLVWKTSPCSMHQLSHVRVQRRETLEEKIETKIPQFEQFFQREQFLEISLCPSLPGSPNSSLLVQPSTSEDEIFLAKGLKMNNFDKLFGKRFVYKECVNVVAAATNHPCLQTSLELDRCWRERVVNATFGLHGGAFLLCEDFSFVVFPWSHKTQSS